MNILLSGPPFSGKTTISKELANVLKWDFIDTDARLEDQYSITCTEQFKQFGEERFRENENVLLTELEKETTKTVISLGGGVITHIPNAKTVKKLGFLVCLECPLELLYERVKKSGRIPAYLDPLDLKGALKTLCEKRKKHYQEYGDFFLDVATKTPLQSALEIVEEYKRFYGK